MPLQPSPTSMAAQRVLRALRPAIRWPSTCCHEHQSSWQQRRVDAACVQASTPPGGWVPCSRLASISHTTTTFATASASRGPAASESAPPDLPSVDSITSVANPYVKHCVKLRTSARYRAEAGRFLLVGSELLNEAAGGIGSLQARVLFVSEACSSSSAAAAAAAAHLDRPASASGRQAAVPRAHSTPGTSSRGPGRGSPAPETRLVPGLVAQRTVQVSEAVMKKLTGLESVAGVDVVAEIDVPPSADFARPGVQVRRLLALDRVQDPGNMGTLLRTAIAFGFDGAFLLHGCVDPFGDKAVRAGRGAALRLPLARGTLQDLQQLAAAQNLKLLAAEPDEDQQRTKDAAHASASNPPGRLGDAAAASVHGERKAPEPGVCLVLGSEGQGLSREVLGACEPVAIPMAGGLMESLNVGIAGGILMFMLSEGGPKLAARLQQVLEVPSEP